MYNHVKKKQFNLQKKLAKQLAKDVGINANEDVGLKMLD